MLEETSNVYGNLVAPTFADVIEAIKEDRAPLRSGVAGRNMLSRWFLAIYKSQKEGAPVRLRDRFCSLIMRGEFVEAEEDNGV